MSNPKVELHIANYGLITLELDADKAPKSVANFLSYVNKGHYDGTVFHRVIPGFMVARTNAPHSASSQFFINVSDNGFLNHTGQNASGWGYAVFGKVVEGKEVVDKIKAVKTGSKGGHSDVPQEDVIIEKAVALA